MKKINLLIFMILVFILVSCEAPTYTINFYNESDALISSISVIENDTVVLPENPSREGYDFVGWTSSLTSNVIFNEEMRITSNLDLYAVWSINTYTISFETNGGSAIENYSFNYGMAISEPNVPVKTGYRFEGWYTDETLETTYVFTTIPAYNVTLYAKWSVVSYDLIFKSDGQVVETYEIPFGSDLSQITPPVLPLKSGYIFEGWSGSIPDVMPATDLIFNAEYSMDLTATTLDVLMQRIVLDVEDFISPTMRTTTTQNTSIQTVDDIVLPYDIGYTFPNEPTTITPDQDDFKNGIWSGRIVTNVNQLFVSPGWLYVIQNMISESNTSATIVETDNTYHIFDDRLEAILTYDEDELDLYMFYANENGDQTVAHYNSESGFFIITSETYFNGIEDVVQLIATYAFKTNDDNLSQYTYFTYESNPIGEDLLLTISDDQYSVTGIMDRYLFEADVPEFRLGHIVITEGDGYGVAEIINPNYNDRIISGWNTIFNLNAFDGWREVVFDGESAGIIYDNEGNVVPQYKVLLLGNIPFITQDMSMFNTYAFTETIFEDMFTYPNGIELSNLEQIKPLFMQAVLPVDISNIGLNEMTRDGLLSFIFNAQSMFDSVSDYYLSADVS